MSEDVSRFDDCKLINAKLYLNSECYPYDDLNLLIKTDSVQLVHAFLQGLLRITSTSSRVSSLRLFYVIAFVIIDYSRQNESIKSGTVAMRLKCKENVPANTTAYCLIIHDRVVQYN